MRKESLVIAIAVASLTAAMPAGAQAPNPAGTACSAPSGLTFAGSGIPVGQLVCATGADGIELIMSATPRLVSTPPVTETAAGSGIFNASAGGTTTPNRSLWNFDYAIYNTNNNTFGAGETTNIFTLFIDHNSADAMDNITYTPLSTPGLGAQNSENLGFASIGGGAFDPNSNGTYTFSLEDRSSQNDLVSRVSINVDVTGGTTATPEPASLVLLGTGLVGLGGFARRRNKRANA